MKKCPSRISLSTHISQRGAGEIINRKEALVYDFMPMILGERFRIDGTLSKMLLRPAPEDAPFMLETDAYETLGEKYIDKGEWNPALECYRIALESRTSFAKFMAGIQGDALLSPNEIGHLDISTKMERGLLKWAMESGMRSDPSAYIKWVNELRIAKNNWENLNRNAYGSKEYVEACLRIGEYKEALSNAKNLNDRKLTRIVKQARPKEILDIGFLKKFIDDNFPESSIGN
jgi:hypothetical protein